VSSMTNLKEYATRSALARMAGFDSRIHAIDSHPVSGDLGSSHDGWIHLIYFQDPGLEEGEAFPLWTMSLHCPLGVLNVPNSSLAFTTHFLPDYRA
jgi:hypothetical protein